MRADDKNTESEDELVDMTKQDQVIIEEKGGDQRGDNEQRD